MNIYAIRDAKTASYSAPFTEKNDVEMIRGFEMAMQNTQNKLYAFAQDFDIFKIGEYEQIDGKIIVLPEKQHVSSMLLIKEKACKQEEE